MSPKKTAKSRTISPKGVIEGQLAADRALQFAIWQLEYLLGVIVGCTLIIAVILIGISLNEMESNIGYRIHELATWFYSKWELP